MFAFIVFAFLFVARTQAASTGCTYKGHSYNHGDSWVADDRCNGCDCTDFGAECASWKNCDNSNELGAPGTFLCKYYHTYYHVGQSWTAEDKCNSCKCTKNGMICTYKPCKNSGFDKPKANGGQFMDCPYKSRYYHYGSQFLADDGCNSCICTMPGNYATFPICTTTKCNLIG